MAFFTKGIVISFVAGIAAGVIGSRLYESHKGQIESGLGSLRNRFAANGLVEDSDSAAEEDSVTLEELEKQRRHLRKAAMVSCSDMKRIKQMVAQMH